MLHDKDEQDEASDLSSVYYCHKQRHDGANYIRITKLLGHVPRPKNLVHFPSAITIHANTKQSSNLIYPTSKE